ncbi:MAG: o-succinylbenzoate synthase, partial [Flavobacteriaceae bacterium]
NAQIKARLSDGFRCLKLKIGAHDFDQEYQLIRQLRGQYNPDDLEIRVDANGAFDQKTALEKLKRLSELKLHSIEQPIMPGQWSSMAELVAQSPVDIALDEELIGLYSDEEKCRMIDEIKPDYLILKPSLIGGFDRAKQWIDWAENRDIGWWVTSALESNIGLNAIAQFTASESCSMPQGLGTGSLYLNNIPSPLVVEQAKLYYDLGQQWSFNFLNL